MDVSTPRLNEAVLRRFSLAAQKRSLPAKHPLLRSDSRSDRIFLVLEGSITATIEGECGREVMLTQFHPGDFCGERSLYPGDGLGNLVIRTRRVSLVAEMEVTEFEAFCCAHPEVLFELTRQLAARVQQMSERLADLAFCNVSERILRTLDTLCEGPEVTLLEDGSRRLTVSRQELARHVGCSREMVGRVIKQLEDERRLRSVGRALIFPRRSGSAAH